MHKLRRYKLALRVKVLRMALRDGDQLAILEQLKGIEEDFNLTDLTLKRALAEAHATELNHD